MLSKCRDKIRLANRWLDLESARLPAYLGWLANVAQDDGIEAVLIAAVTSKW